MKYSRIGGLLPLLMGFLLVLGKAGYGQSDWETLFYDDFQSGITEQWELQEGWSVIQVDTSYVLAGEGHYWANCKQGSTWLDYSFKCKVNIQYGAMHVNFRLSERGRYMLGLSTDQIYLVRDDFWGTYTDLTSFLVSPDLRNVADNLETAAQMSERR